MFLLYIVTIFSIFFMIWGYRDYHKKDFQKKKVEIVNMYSALLSDINTDYSEDVLNTQNIVNVGVSIRNLTNKIEQINKHSEIKVSVNKEWVVGLMCEFRKYLQLWIYHHKAKLSEQSEFIEKMQSTENSFTPIELAKQRIDLQIQLYSKV